MALKSMGCDVVQGYYFSRPLPADEFEAYVKGTRMTNAEIHKTFSDPKPAARYTYDALHDALTGMYNQTAFEILLKDSDKEHIAVLIVNVNEYEELKSSAGLKAADEAVLRVSRVLRSGFRSVDDICRLRENEFAVIMTRVNSNMQDLIFDKVERANAILGNPGQGEIPVSLSVGVAFSDRKNPKGSIFEDADAALQRMKQSHGSGCQVF
jgi:diguanylate cyclase (GGDEF)-like protein